MHATAELGAELAALQDDYTYQVNLLLDEGRRDLAAKVADRYVEEVALLVRSASAAADRARQLGTVHRN